MSTKNFVPRANNEGGIGTEAKQWGSVWSKNIYVDGTNVKNTLTTLEQNIGTLNIAAATKATTFNSVALMKEAPLEPGMVAMTTGYYSPNDEGSGFYNIRTKGVSDVDDGGSIIILDNGNVAELIIGESVNVHQFGAKGNANYYNYTDGNSYANADTSSSTVAPYIDNVTTTDIVKNYVSAVFNDEGLYEYDGKRYYSATATEAVYEDNVNGGWYASATFTTEGTYLNPNDGKHYVNYDIDTDTYSTEAPYHDNVADKWYVSAVYTDEGTYTYNSKYWYITDGVEAPYYDNVGNKWYVTATYSDKANALLNGTWYYGVVFSTPAQDDTTAIQNAINTHKPIELLNGHTYIVESFTAYNGFILKGNGATLRRPNFKLAPYSKTDTGIKWSRIFDLAYSVIGENYNDAQTEFHDVTIDGNATAMWTYGVDSTYMYEQGILIFINGNASHKNKVLIDNVRFLNNYAAPITAYNYTEVTINNCRAYDCLKGLIVLNGDANIINVNNCIVDSINKFTAFWSEPNSSISGEETIVNINNCVLKGRFNYLSTSAGALNVTNCRLVGEKETSLIKVGAGFSASISNSKIEADKTVSFALRGDGNINFSNCDVGYLKNGFTLVKASSNDFYAKITFDHCIMHDSLWCIVTDNSVKYEILIDGCRFYNIESGVLGHGASNSTFRCKSCYVSNCIFDVATYLYSATGSGSDPIIFNGGNDVVNINNLGFNTYGRETMIFKDELWSFPAKIKQAHTGSTYIIKGYGKRTTLVSEAPTFRGVNDIDHAQLTVSPYTKYTYTNNAWVEDV